MRSTGVIVAAVITGVLAIVATVAGAKFQRDGCLFCDATAPPVGEAPPAVGEAAQVKALSFPAEFGGRWEGPFEETNGRVWPMTLTIVAGQAEAAVRYDGNMCAGTVTIVGGAAGPTGAPRS